MTTFEANQSYIPSEYIEEYKKPRRLTWLNDGESVVLAKDYTFRRFDSKNITIPAGARLVMVAKGNAAVTSTWRIE